MGKDLTLDGLEPSLNLDNLTGAINRDPVGGSKVVCSLYHWLSRFFLGPRTRLMTLTVRACKGAILPCPLHRIGHVLAFGSFRHGCESFSSVSIRPIGLVFPCPTNPMKHFTSNEDEVGIC